ncbi:MAG: hypothetical protein ACREKG_11570 [Candidatus Rokuibacteriota bacterium]
MDTETRAYLDAALEGLRQEIRAGATETADLRQEMRAEAAELRQEMRAERAELRQEMRAETAELRQEIRAETAELRAETAELRQETAELRQEILRTAAATVDLRQEMGAGMTGLRREMRETAEETRRHFDVVGESIRSDVRAVAEGVAANSEAIERLGGDLRAEMDSRFTASHAVVRVALQELRRDIQERGGGR